jgi:hypothetical protein
LETGIHSVAVAETKEQLLTSERLRVFHNAMIFMGISLSEPPVRLPPVRFGTNYDVVDPKLYVETKTVKWPGTTEEYDPDKDTLWDDEGIGRKFETPLRTYEQLRPLVDPEPKIYLKARADDDDVTAPRKIIDGTAEIKFLNE